MEATSNDENTVDLAEYLFTRLHQLGIRTVQGVPGDYNLVALDYLRPAGLKWTGNANALNAGYAADGYARVKGISALITTFGVGEFSAITAIGGACAERAPVVHIVGTPPTSAHWPRLNLHPPFGDENFTNFSLVYNVFSCAREILTDAATAPRKVDLVLQQCVQESRPVYIGLPSNMAKAKVSSEGLKRSIDVSFKRAFYTIEDVAVMALVDHIKKAKRPVIIVDGLTPRYNLLSEAQRFVSLLGWPTYVTPFGKGCVDESLRNFHGVYIGSAADADVHANWVQSSDLVIRFGPLEADTHAYGFSTLTGTDKTIFIHRIRIHLAEVTVRTDTKPILRRVLEILSDLDKTPPLTPYPDLPRPRERLDSLLAPARDAKIDQKTFWPRVSRFLRPHDIVLAETGTSSAGANNLVLPAHIQMIRSALWLSAGYALAAAVGASQAQKDMATLHTNSARGRTILFEGDGSFQMTAQALSDIFRNRLDVIIFLINNNGYTTERYLHGRTAQYNNVHPWKYLDAPAFFGAPVGDPSYPVVTRKAVNWGELLDVLGDEDVAAGKGFCMVEVVVEREDAPEELKRLADMTAKRNRGEGA